MGNLSTSQVVFVCVFMFFTAGSNLLNKRLTERVKGIKMKLKIFNL
jgi:hypothetical protein